MNADAGYVRFLQTYLPRLVLRWAGFRKVRKQVVKRLRLTVAAANVPMVGDIPRGRVISIPSVPKVRDVILCCPLQ